MFYDFITIGGVTEDIIFFSKDGVMVDNKKNVLKQKLLAFEYGAKINIKECYQGFGGGASNTAVNLAKMGFKVACLASIGDDDRGKRILENFDNNKIDTKLINVDKKSNTGFSFIISDKKDRIIFSYRGANDNLSLTDKQKAILKKAEWLYLTSLPDDSISILKNIFANKNKIAWNPGLNQLSGGIKKIAGFLKVTDIFMVNKDEALELIKKTPELSGYNNKFLDNCENLIKILKGCGPKIIILTDGINGAYIYDGKFFHHQAVIKRAVEIDTTGVGDAFNSTVLGSLLKIDGDYKKAMYWGMKNTASLVAKFGAQNGLLSLKNIK